MSVNNTNSQKNSGVSSPFGNSVPPNPTPRQFQLSQFAVAQAHAHAMAHTAQAKAAAQANHAQLQAQGLALNQSHGPLATNSPPFAGSGNPGAKRASQKPLGRPPGSVNHNTASPMRLMELTPSARNRKKQKLSGKQLQEKVAAILPSSALYMQLLEFESRVDAALMRKKVDIQEAIKNPPYVQKTLRIYVFNTYANQIQTIPQMPNAEPPSWTMKIIGRVLEEGTDPDPMYQKFSSFFKRVAISLDKNLYPDNHTIEWHNTQTSTHHEGFEVKRKGDKEFTVNIKLDMNYLPEKFRLSSPLTEVLGIEVDTRSRIISAIWQYVKARKLQNADDPSYFNCDPPLLKVFGQEKVKFSMVSKTISAHLAQPQSIHLEHEIKLSGNCPAGSACYDVKVDVPLLVKKDLNALLAKSEKTKEIETCEEAICTTIRKINEHRKRRAFFLGFSESPVEFIDALIESQGRDLKLIAGDVNRNAEKENQADFYNQHWVEDAVIRYLNRKQAKISNRSI